VEGFDDLVASDLLARQDPADHHLRRVEGCALGGFLAEGPASQSAARGIVHLYLLPRQVFEERFCASKNVSALMVYHAAAAAAPPQ
jgi:hypothetical protein